MAFVTAFSRILLPGIALIILIRCILSLWLGHPKEKTYGYIIDMINGEKYALNMWETSIGRATGCDITLSYDSVARTHAVFTRRIDGWYIYDISPNRSLIKVNGTKVDKKQTVVDGDIISLGSIRFRFEVTDDPVVKVKKRKNNKRKASSKSAASRNNSQDYKNVQVGADTPLYDIDRKNSDTSESFTVETPASTKAPAGNSKRPSQPKIINKDTGEAFVLCGNEIVIGSGRGADIRLGSKETAKKHAVLILYEDGWAIGSLSENKPTYLNGQKVKSPQLLFNGDVIALGDERLFYEAGRKR